MAHLAVGAHMFLDALTCVNSHRSFNVFFLISLTFNILLFQSHVSAVARVQLKCPLQDMFYISDKRDIPLISHYEHQLKSAS